MSKKKYQQPADLLQPGADPQDLGLINTIQTLEQEDLSSSGVESMFAPRQYDIDFNAYDEYIQRPFSVENEDIDDTRAYQQSVGEKSLYGVQKLFGKTATAVAGGVGMLLHGLPNMLMNVASEAANPEENEGDYSDAFRSIFENDFQRSLDGVNEWMDGKLPHYYTKAEQEMGVFQQMAGGSANFWANDFVNGLSFVAGAVLTEFATAGMATAIMPARATQFLKGVHRANKINRATTAAGTASKLNQAANYGKMADAGLLTRRLITGAGYESGVEARHHYDATINALEGQWREENMLGQPTMEDKKEWHELAVETTNGVFVGNLALVGAGNMIAFPRIFGSGFNQSKRSLGKVVRDAGDDVANRYKAAYKSFSKGEKMAAGAYTALRVPLYEGFVEEGGQALMDRGGQHSALGFYADKKDPTTTEAIVGMIDGMYEKFAENYGDKHVQKEIALGFILGAMGLPTMSRTNEDTGKKESGFGWTGGIYGQFTERTRKRKGADKLAAWMNENPSAIKSMKRNFEALNQSSRSNEKMDYALMTNNIHSWKNAKHDHFFSYVYSRAKAGFYEDVIEDINEIKRIPLAEFAETFGYANQDLTTEELESRRDRVITKALDRAGEIRNAEEVVGRNFSGFSTEIQEMMAHSTSVAKDTDARTESVRNRLQEHGVDLSALEDAELSETKIINAYRSVAKEQGVLSKIDAIVRDLIEEGSDVSMAYQKAFEQLGLMQEIASEEQGQPVTEAEFSDASLRYQVYSNSEQLKKIEAAIKSLSEKNKGENYTQENQNKLNDLNSQFIELKRKQGLSTKALADNMEAELTTQDVQVLNNFEQSDPVNFAQYKEETVQDLIDLRRLRARRHSFIGLYNSLKTPQGQEESLQQIEDIITSQKQSAEESQIEDVFIRDLYSKYGNGQIFEFDYTNNKGESTNYRAIFLNPKQIMILPSSVAANHLSRFKYEARLKELEGQTDKKSIDEVTKIKRILDKYFPEAQTQDSVWEVDAINQEKMTNVKAVPMEEYRLELLKRAVRNVRENQFFNIDQITQDIAKKEKEINDFFQDLMDIEDLQEIPGVSLYELNEVRIKAEALIEQHEAAITSLTEAKLNIEREARHLDTILDYYKDSSLTNEEKYEKIIGVSVITSIQNEAKEIFKEFGLESDPVYGTLLADTDLESLASAVEDSEFLSTPTQDYLAEVDNAITQYERALFDIKRARDVIEETIRDHAERQGVVGARNMPIEWITNLIDKDASNFFKEELALLEEERAKIAEILENKKKESGARERATELLSTIMNLKGRQAIIVDQLAQVENFMGRFFQPPAEIVKDMDEKNPITQFSSMTLDENNTFFRYAGSLLNGIGFFKTAGSHKVSLDMYSDLMALSIEERSTPENQELLQTALNQIAYFKFVGDMKYPSKYLLKAVSPATPMEGVPHYNETDIKMVVVDSITGEAVLDKDKNLIFTSMMEPYAFMPNGEYRFAKTDFADPANPTAEELAEIDKRVKFYADFRQSILQSDSSLYFEISDKSNAIRIFEDGNYDSSNSVVGRIVKDTNQLKDVNVIIAKAPKGEVYAPINFMDRRLVGKNGMAYTVKNGQLVHLRPSKLADMQDVKDNVYNLLVQYAKNEEIYRTTNDLDLKDVNKLPGSEQTIDAILKQYIYWGAQASNRTLTEYSIYWEKGVLKFGNDNITHTQLMDPTNNEAQHDALKSFLSTLLVQINRFNINDDITARKKALDASKGKKKVTPVYTKFIQTLVDEEGVVTTKTWKNYTEFLLAERNGTQPALTTNIVEDIEYANQKKLIPNQRITTPQFMNPYLKFNGQSVGLKTKKSKYKKQTEVPKQVGIGGLELVAIEAGKTYRVYGTVTGSTERTYIDAPIILTPINGTDMLQFDVNASILQEGVENEAKITARLNALNATIAANLGVITPTLLAEINADFSSRGSNVQMALVERGENDPLFSKTTATVTGIDALSNTETPEVIDIETLNLTQNEGPAAPQQSNSILDNLEEEDDAPFLSTEYATTPKENYTTWNPIEETEWYNTVMPKDSNNNFLIPMEVMKNLIDGHAFGKLTKDGNILLYKDAIEGALYHEAFHGVTRLLLPTAERLALYDEARAMKGKVTTYSGKFKKMSELTDKEADEWLAEEFRKYNLSNGTYKIGKGRKLSVLDKIMEWLSSIIKFITGGSTQVQELFDRINSGGFKNASIINQNRAANVYMSPGEASFTRAVYEGMTPAFTDVAIQERDLGFYDFYDLELSGKDSHKLAGIYGKTEDITNNINTAPMSVLKKLAIRSAKLKRAAVSPKEKAKVDSNYTHILENWQSYVEGHLKYIKYFNLNISATSILEEDSKNDLAAQINEKDETDPTKSMAAPLKLLIGSAPMVDKNGKAVMNELGFYKPVDFYDVTGYLYRSLANAHSETEMIQKFTESVQYKPELKSIGRRLKLATPLNSKTDENTSELNWGDVRMRLSFINQFNKSNDDYLIYMMEENGKDKYFINANVNKLESVIKREWKANLEGKLNMNDSPFSIAENGAIILDKTIPLSYRKTVQIGNKIQQDKAKTVEQWSKSTWDFSDAIGILSSLGIEFSNTLSVKPEVINTATAWILYELSSNESPVSNLFESDLDIAGRMNELLQEEARTSSLGLDLSFQNHEGKTIFGVSEKTYLNVIVDKLNNMSVEELNILQTDKANLKGSYWIEKLKAGNKLKVSNLQGSRIDVIGARGRHISKGTKGDITSMHLTAIMDGVSPFIRSADMKSEFGIGFGIKNEYLNYTTIAGILSNQLADEIRTSILLNSKGVGNNVAGYKDNAKDLRYFKGIVSIPGHMLTDYITEASLMSYVSSESIKDQLLAHVKSQMAEMENHLKEYEFIVPGKEGNVNIGLSNTQLTALSEAASIPYDGIHISQTLLDAYLKQAASSQIISVIEMSKIMLGDLALFNTSNIFKRSKLAAGAKTYPVTGVGVNEWLNTNMPRKYSEHSDKLISVVRQDIKIDAEFLEEYVSVVRAKFGDVAAENTRTSMSNMDEFDGGGFIHLDAQRSLSLKTNEWSIKQEAAFNEIEEGGEMSPETIAYFPDMKPQYFGDFEIGQVSLKTGYKFALFPIHENMVNPNSTLYSIARNMRESATDIQVFESVSKIGAVTQPNGEFLSMYQQMDNIQELNSNSEMETFSGLVYNPITPETTTHVLETGLMGMQVKQSPKLKYQTTVGTQERTQIKANLYENGEIAEEFAELESNIQLMDEAYEAITEKGISELVSRTGLILKDGKYIFNSDNTELLESFIVDEMQSRDMSRHLTDSVSDLLSRDSRFVDLLMSKPKIENLLMSLAVGHTVKQKTSGSMMVQRASTGLESQIKAVKQKDFELNNRLPGVEMSPLKFYSKNEDGSINAMQILIPHHFKELMGLNPDINNGMFDKSLFKLIGFRIPTETLASIEFIEVVGFLPEGHTSVVVPSEIVGKSGSDYDIDKLTLYFPNYEVVQGKFKKVAFLTGTSQGAIMERIQKMRKTEPASYLAVVSELLPSNVRTSLDSLLSNKETISKVIRILKDNPTTKDLIKDIKETTQYLNTSISESISELYETRLRELNLELVNLIENSVGEEMFTGLTEYANLTNAISGIQNRLESIDEQLAPEFAELPLAMQNTKKALQNVVLDAHYSILSHPANYANLLTPIGASSFKRLRDLIVQLKVSKYTNRLDILNSIGRTLTKQESDELLNLKQKLSAFEEKDWAQVLSFTNIINKSSNMWSGLGGVGVGAVSAVDNVRGQQIGMKVNPLYLKENPNAGLWFEGFSPNEFSLSRRRNIKGDLNISTGLSELINGYVDVTADDWVYMINAGMEFAPLWSSYLRAGLDIQTLGLFMNQPIVDEFVYQKQIKQSSFRDTSNAKTIRRESNSYILSRLRKKLKKASKLPNRLLDAPSLASLVGSPIDSMNSDQLAIQMQVLNMLESYMKLSDELSQVHKVTAYDTNTPKDRASIKYRSVLRKVMSEKNIFQDKEGKDAIDSILELPVLKGFTEATNTFPVLYASLFATESMENYDKISENFIRQGLNEGISEDDIVYRLNRFENHIITHTLHNSNLGDNSNTLLRSRAKYLMQGLSSLPRRVATYKRSMNNLLLNELHPMLQQHTNPKHPDYSVDNLTLRRKKLAPRDLELLGDAFIELYETPSTKTLAEEILYFSLLQSGMNFSSISIFHAIPDHILLNMAEDVLSKITNSAVDYSSLIRSFYANNWKDGRISTYIGRSKLRQFTGFKVGAGDAIIPVGNSQKGFQEGVLGVLSLSRDAQRQSMTVSIPLVSNKVMAAYKKAGKSAPKSTKLFINTGEVISNKGTELMIFTELDKKGNGNRHIEIGQGSLHTANRVIDAQFIPFTVQPLGLKSVRESIASSNLTKLVLTQDLKTYAGGDGIIKTGDNAVLKLRKLGSYTRQQIEKQGVKSSLGITSLDDLMQQAGLNSYPYYAKLFKKSKFVETKTKGPVHIYEVEILNSGYYTADTKIEISEENTSGTISKAITKDAIKKTAEQIAASQEVLKKFEENC